MTRYATVLRFVVTFSVNVWWVLETCSRSTYSKHLLSILSRIVMTRQKVEHNKADASMPDIYKYKCVIYKMLSAGIKKISC